MISRASAKAIADAYHSSFTSWSHPYGSRRSSAQFKFHGDELYDFLYVNNFDAWFLNAAKGTYPHHERQLREFIQKLHTGESVAANDWSWKQRQSLGQRVLADLAAALIGQSLKNPPPNDRKEGTAIDAMQRALELDGYVYRNGVLLIPEETVLDEQEEEGVLQTLFSECRLNQRDVFDHHLGLSSEHYRNGKWDDSIANSRKVLEVVLQESAATFGARRSDALSAGDLDRPVKVRDYLEQVGILAQKEKEAVSKIYGLLSDTGGHPYIAQQDQARLMRHYALTTAQFTLLRLKGAMTKGGS